jgi:hypothetical protein
LQGHIFGPSFSGLCHSRSSPSSQRLYILNRGIVNSLEPRK